MRTIRRLVGWPVVAVGWLAILIGRGLFVVGLKIAEERPRLPPKGGES